MFQYISYGFILKVSGINKIIQLWVMLLIHKLISLYTSLINLSAKMIDYIIDPWQISIVK